MKVREARASGKRVRQGTPARAVQSTPRRALLTAVVHGAPMGARVNGLGIAELAVLPRCGGDRG
jgi:hypothetical protein